ncbi:MAG: glycosyl transferase [bacterium]
MNYNFCTLFDKNYLYKGLALYNSLVEKHNDFKLWILCMDDIAYQTLCKLNLKNTELIRLTEFEDKELLAVKPKRTTEEYCWTCAPSLTCYILKKYNLDIISYIDADMYFYSSCKPIFDELGDNSIMIIPHRFKQEDKHLEKTKGIYNVSMVSFKNNHDGIKALKWWRARCLEWCHHYYENGKLGDQLYLNDWPERFNGVYVLKHLGANAAPWNISQYEIAEKTGKIFINGMDLIFYHFHSLKIYSKRKFGLSYENYSLSDACKKLIYKPYLVGLKIAIDQINAVDKKFNYGFAKKPCIFAKTKKIIKKILKI